jgi:murein DD-endopeptidase MepM/ murein hydrolase activator NlpD
MISSLLGGNRQDTFGEPLQLLAALGARRQQSRSQELPVQPATTLPKPQFGEIGKATGPYPYSPLGGAKYRPLGAPGQGTHSTGEGPDNWQSDNAWDYGADPGTPVYATDSGVVTGGYGESASSGRFGGSRVNISGGQRPGGEFYQHLAPNLAVKPGEKVTVGQLIGYVGKVPGLGPHLHYGQERL